MSYDKLCEQVEDGVDPRVQVELERLNTSTDEINKLEVDLDDARNQFRHLLQESSTQIEHWSKKLGTCIVKVRPYYDARIQAKEALQETQRAASKFERANSAHAAAKEMVYLAEEGLKAEGRTFDHAWQEMLNHATMRVNESEAERTTCEAEHRKTSQNYQLAESRVRSLQKELKRAITKSRPYFELKIHYMQLLEKQKLKVKNLEKQVADVKLTYAHTLKNLEQISDEIHKTRQRKMLMCDEDLRGEKAKEEVKITDLNLARERCDAWMRNGTLTCEGQPSSGPKADFRKAIRLPEYENNLNNIQVEYGTGANDNCRKETLKILSPIPDLISRSPTHASITTSFSSQPDTDFWSENSEDNFKASPSSENESSLTGPPDTESEEETFRHPGRHGSAGSAAFPGESRYGGVDSYAGGEPLQREGSFFQSTRTESIPREPEFEFNLNFENDEFGEGFKSEWTEIKLRSPEEEIFSTVKVFNAGKGRSELEEFNIPYAPLAEPEGELAGGPGSGENVRARLLATRIEPSDGEEPATKSLKGTPKKLNLRRQSLDVLWSSTAGEKVKEILSQGILRLSISTLAEKKPNESKAEDGNEPAETRTEASYEPVGTSQFGINFFNRKNSKVDDDVHSPCLNEKRSAKYQDSSGSFKSKGERFFNKKIPSPLERTLNYLNTDDDSNSDSESMSSLDIFTDEQLSSLVLDKDLAEIYQDII